MEEERIIVDDQADPESLKEKALCYVRENKEKIAYALAVAAIVVSIATGVKNSRLQLENKNLKNEIRELKIENVKQYFEFIRENKRMSSELLRRRSPMGGVKMRELQNSERVFKA